MRFEIGECQVNGRFGGSASADMAALGQWRQLAQCVKERFERLIGGKVKADSLLGGAHDHTSLKLKKAGAIQSRSAYIEEIL